MGLVTGLGVGLVTGLAVGLETATGLLSVVAVLSRVFSLQTQGSQVCSLLVSQVKKAEWYRQHEESALQSFVAQESVVVGTDA